MKKLIIISLIFALILPAAAFAADGNSPFFGEWAGSEHHATMHYGSIIHYIEITKYTTSSYFVFNLHSGGGITRASIDESSEAYASNWEIVDDHIRVNTSAITYVDLFYDAETDTLYTKDPKVTYVRLP